MVTKKMLTGTAGLLECYFVKVGAVLQDWNGISSLWYEGTLF